MSALVLDTHAWVWWVSRPDKLSRAQRAAVDRARKRAGESLLLSVVSGWEVALLVQAGRLRVPVPLEAWLGQAMAVPGLEVVPLTVPIMATAAGLAVLRDPADMLIVATARHHGARLVTSDARIDDSKVVEVVG